MRTTRLAGHCILRATPDPEMRTTQDVLPRAGRRLVYVVSGEVFVGQDAKPVGSGNLIEVDSGEAMLLRSATGYELWELQFDA